jgi:hypothetical protein
MERLSIYQTATEEKNKIETKFRKQTDEEKLFAKRGLFYTLGSRGCSQAVTFQLFQKYLIIKMLTLGIYFT